MADDADSTGSDSLSSETAAPDLDTGGTGTTGGDDGLDDDADDASDDLVEPMPDLPPVDPPCPDAEWPDDGSEVIEFVAESSVADWNDAGMAGIYFSYLSDDSPIPGQPTLGLTTTSENASVFNFGATLQQMPAESLRGKRIRMRSQAAYADVEGHAGLWLRVDTADGTANLDNASDHPAVGTSTGWEVHEVVLDVPDDAETLVFGSLLTGPGNYVITNPVFEVVTDEVPSTSPNRRRPALAQLCSEPTDEFVEEIVHYVRPDTWSPSEVLAWGEEFARDTEMTYDAVPSLHVKGAFTASFEGALLWAGQTAGRRLRLTVPVRSTGFEGTARLLFRHPEGETTTTRMSEPLDLADGADWELFSVVTELGDEPEAFAGIGIQIEGEGEVWVGYGVVEEVTADVPLSPLER